MSDYIIPRSPYMTENLILNTLTFEYPKEPVKFYFSVNDDTERKNLCLYLKRLDNHQNLPICLLELER